MLGLNLLLSLIVMYLVMYTMIDGWQDYRNNINMLYMALTMWAPMGILMIATMPGMFPNRSANIALYVVFALLTAEGTGVLRPVATVGWERDAAFFDHPWLTLPQLPLRVDADGNLRAAGDLSDGPGPSWWGVRGNDRA